MSSVNYKRVAEAIVYLRENYTKQPSLDQVAENVALSPYHLQRLFSEWAGVSPKQFLQYISLQHAKKVLLASKSNLLQTAQNTGLSGTGRLHDLFVKIEGMTPGEYRNYGIGLNINYSFEETPFGDILIASTERGICHAAFVEEKDRALQRLRACFVGAYFKLSRDQHHEDIMTFFSRQDNASMQLQLHLKGTPFQIKVWEALLKIPSGMLSTYKNIAETIQRPRAARAVGTAVGSNPVAFIIPCHRVIQSTGVLGGYEWGEVRKAALIGWEAAQTTSIPSEG